jgi:hypothetical protein
VGQVEDFETLTTITQEVEHEEERTRQSKVPKNVMIGVSERKVHRKTKDDEGVTDEKNANKIDAAGVNIMTVAEHTDTEADDNDTAAEARRHSRAKRDAEGNAATSKRCTNLSALAGDKELHEFRTPSPSPSPSPPPPPSPPSPSPSPLPLPSPPLF